MEQFIEAVDSHVRWYNEKRFKLASRLGCDRRQGAPNPGLPCDTWHGARAQVTGYAASPRLTRWESIGPESPARSVAARVSIAPRPPEELGGRLHPVETNQRRVVSIPNAGNRRHPAKMAGHCPRHRARGTLRNHRGQCACGRVALYVQFIVAQLTQQRQLLVKSNSPSRNRPPHEPAR